MFFNSITFSSLVEASNSSKTFTNAFFFCLFDGCCEYLILFLHFFFSFLLTSNAALLTATSSSRNSSTNSSKISPRERVLEKQKRNTWMSTQIDKKVVQRRRERLLWLPHAWANQCELFTHTNSHIEGGVLTHGQNLLQKRSLDFCGWESQRTLAQYSTAEHTRLSRFAWLSSAQSKRNNLWKQVRYRKRE
jgi:hypothetical protein